LLVGYDTIIAKSKQSALSFEGQSYNEANEAQAEEADFTTIFQPSHDAILMKFVM
jgi:hypothetical protein